MIWTVAMPASRLASLGLVMAVLALGLGCTAPGNKSKKKSFGERVQHRIQSTLNDSYHDENADAKLVEAEALYQRGQFEAAQKIYAELAANTYNSASMIERSRFMEGECLRARKKYPAAVDAYHRLLQDFPAGVYSERAGEHMYTIAELWLKDVVLEMEDAQKPGLRLAKRNPWPNFTDSTRPRVDQEGELVKTLENIVTGCPLAPFADKAMFWAGYLHFVRGRFEEADHFFSQLVEAHKDSPLRQEALKYAVMAKNNSTGGALYDGQKCAEALQLVHHMEATDPRYTQDKDKSAWLTRQKMAIRFQQAEKDFEQAEYYRRTNHLGPAFFYYDMVQRRYPGTKFSDLAKERLQEIEKEKARRQLEKNNAPSAWQSLWDRLSGKVRDDEDGPAADPTPGQRPAGPKDAPPKALPSHLMPTNLPGQ